MNKLYEENVTRNLNILENYNEALKIVRKKYSQAECSQITVQLFALDFMIKSNQRILDYLNHFKKHQRALSTQALKDILKHVDTTNDVNIHETIRRLRYTIMVGGKIVSERLKNDYNFRGMIYGALGVGFSILVVSSPIIGMFLIPIVPGLSLLVFKLALFMVISLALACLYQAILYAQPGSFFYLINIFNRELECLEVKILLDDPADSTLFKKVDVYKDYLTTDTENKENHSLIEEKRYGLVLREKFEQKLAEDVEVEYLGLNRSRFQALILI